MSPQEGAQWFFTGLFALAAAYERYRNSRHKAKDQGEADELAEARRFRERAEMMGKLADQNLELYQNEHKEHVKARDYWHEKASKDQADLSAAQLNILELKSRPDYSEFLHILKDQGEAIKEILIILTKQNT